MKLSVAHLFQTPLIVDTIADHRAINAALAPAIMRLSSGEQGSWQGALSSSDDVAAAALGRVVRQVVSLSEQFTRDEKSVMSSRYRWAPRVWANIAAPGHTIEPPKCWDAFWKAEYMIDDGYGASSDRAMAGEFIIDDPRLPMPMAELPELRMRTVLDERAAAYEPEIAVRPSTGRLLMHPGWLRVRRRPLVGGSRSLWLTIGLTALLK